MTFLDLTDRFLYIPSPSQIDSHSSTSFDSFVLDAADEKAAVIFRVPKTGTISKVLWRTNIVTTGATVDVRLETLSGRDPSGTLIAAGANGSEVLVSGGADDNVVHTTTLTTPPSVTKGDLVALVVVNPSASPGDFQVSRLEFIGMDTKFPYVSLFTTFWSSNTGRGVCAVEYNDGSYANAFTTPYTTLARDMITTTGTPDEVALRFKLPFRFRLTGFWVDVDIEPGDPAYRLYDSDGTTVLEEISDASFVGHGSGNGGVMYHWTQTHDLLADTFYRISFRPTASNVRMYSVEVPTAAAMDALDGGQNFHWSERTDFGSWSETLTKKPRAGLIIDGVQAPALGVVAASRLTGGFQ